MQTELNQPELVQTELNPVQILLLKAVLDIRALEDALLDSPYFKDDAPTLGVKNPKTANFKSPTLMLAWRELRTARMMAGDLLRLFGVEKPYNNSFIGENKIELPKYLELGKVKEPKEFWEIFANTQKEESKFTNEVTALAYCRTKLGKAKPGLNGGTGLFYSLVDANEVLYSHLVADLKASTPTKTEYKVYYSKLLESLKMANCHLGLRFGEVVSN
jgi:hypothetical protein